MRGNSLAKVITLPFEVDRLGCRHATGLGFPCQTWGKPCKFRPQSALEHRFPPSEVTPTP